MSKTVLIVDDDVAFADFLRAAVESVGHATRLVSTGTDALAAFDAARPDLVFLDLLLPGRDGFKVCEEIRAHPAGATVPVVMMTGIYKKASYEREALEKHRASAYLFKPFGVRETWSLCERFLGAAPRAADPAAGPACARLSETPLASILAGHLARRDDGVLFVRGATTTQVLYLRKGAPIFARSNDPEDRLDRVLLRSGQVTEGQVAAALAAVAEGRSKLRFGQALVDMGCLKAEQVEVALQLQLQLILNRAFGHEDGRCFFVAGEHPTEEDVLLATPPPVLLFRGARAAGSTAAVRASLPKGQARLARTERSGEVLALLNLREAEEQVLALVDDDCTVERFLAVADVAGLDGRRILLGFTCAGVLAAREPARQAAPAPARSLDAGAWCDRPFASTFLEAHAARVTGALCVSTAAGGPAKRILFREGDVVACESDIPEDRAYDVLVALELASEAALADVLATLGPAADDRGVLREVVQRRLLTPSDAYWARVYQVMSAVTGLLSLPSASLAFEPGLPDDLVPLPDVETAELAWDAARSLSAEEVAAKLPPPHSVLEARPDAATRASRMPLQPAEALVLEALSAPRALSDLLTLGPEDDVRRTACALICTGLATTRAAAPADESDFIDMLHESSYAASEPAPGGFRLVPKAEALARAHVPKPAAEPAARQRAAAEHPVARLGEIVSELRALRPLVRTLRHGMEGSQRRVEVDRASMRELLDTMLRLISDTCAVHAELGCPPAADEPSEQPVETGAAR